MYLPSPLKTIARGCFVLFHIGIWSTSTTYPHLNLLHSPPSHLYPFTQCTYLTVLHFMSNIELMFKGFLNVSPLWVYFALAHSTPSITLPYPFISHPSNFNSFQYTSLDCLPSQMLCFTILVMLYHSLFLSFLPHVL
jgi:hypothetical protein